ncbi:hypothetical protein TrST_g3148 [Triparma strigata]|uniref:Leo1-like protein n=1 Tax=Triparma strigata TaxID=1606541 RepID=A0A9W7F337_9STRA|nr:hypothetical protein TrST_g3148 [Triparma strigata]
MTSLTDNNDVNNNSMSNLFGDDDSSDDESVTNKNKNKNNNNNVDSSSMPPPAPVNLDAPTEVSPTEVSPTEVKSTIELKNYPSIPKGKKLVYTKLPNVVGVQTQEYDEDIYDATEEKQSFPYTSSIIRWRYALKNGAPLRDPQTNARLLESNTRLTTWSDNSQTLTIGSETFSITSTPSPQTYLTLIQPLPSTTLLQSHSPIPSKLSVLPFSLDSASHKSLTLSLKTAHMKKSRIVLTTTSLDPEKQKENKARIREDVSNIKKRKSYNKNVGMGMSSEYLEGGDISSIRNSTKTGELDFGSSSDESDGWAESKKRKKEGDNVEGENEMEESEESEEEDEQVVNIKKGRKKRIVEEEDDE